MNRPGKDQRFVSGSVSGPCLDPLSGFVPGSAHGFVTGFAPGSVHDFVPGLKPALVPEPAARPHSEARAAPELERGVPARG